MEKRNYKLYIHINKINEKRYYGITCRKVEYRWGKNGNGYKFYIDKDGKRHGNEHFWNSICKYGWDNFEHIVLFDNLTKEEAKLMEKMYICLYDTTNQDKGYNITFGGDGGNGYKWTDERKQQQSKRISGENNPMYGYEWTEEQKKDMSETIKKRWEDEEYRERMIEIAKLQWENGRKEKITEGLRKKWKNDEEYRMIMSQMLKERNKEKWENDEEYRMMMSQMSKERWEDEEYRERMSKMSKERWEDEEYRKNQSEKTKKQWENEEFRKRMTGENNPMYGKHHTEEARKIMSEVNKGKNNHGARSVYCIELNMYFDTISEGAKKYKIKSSSNITSCCKGDRNYCGKLSDGTKLVWRYLTTDHSIILRGKDISKLHSKSNQKIA